MRTKGSDKESFSNLKQRLFEKEKLKQREKLEKQQSVESVRRPKELDLTMRPSQCNSLERLTVSILET